GTFVEANTAVHRVIEDRAQRFAHRIGPVFAARHAAMKFDVLEGPDYSADARIAVQLVPDIPLVVKLHTPTFLTVQGTYDGLPFLHPLRRKMVIEETCTKARRYINALRKGRKPSWRYSSYFNVAEERSHVLDADEIVAPSNAIGVKLSDKWKLNTLLLSHVPYPYTPPEELLKIPAATQTNVVSFFGRLEIRKGVLDFAEAIPLICDRFPNASFRFVGPSEHSPDPNIEMQPYLEDRLGRFGKSVEFTG